MAPSCPLETRHSMRTRSRCLVGSTGPSQLRSWVVSYKSSESTPTYHSNPLQPYRYLPLFATDDVTTVQSRLTTSEKSASTCVGTSSTMSQSTSSTPSLSCTRSSSWRRSTPMVSSTPGWDQMRVSSLYSSWRTKIPFRSTWRRSLIGVTVRTLISHPFLLEP